MPTTAISRGTNLGPLQSTFTRAPGCSVAVIECPTCSIAWQAQQCYSIDSNVQGVEDAATCWPSATVTPPSPPLAGWGFYSPGLVCPNGYTTACTAVSQANDDTSSISLATTGPIQGSFQFGLVAGETAVGCCPSGYQCGTDGIDRQTCKAVATSTSFSAVTCESGTSGGFTFYSIPYTTDSTVTISEYTLFAPLIQMNWQRSDRPVSTITVGPSVTSNSDATFATTTSTASASRSSGLGTGGKVAVGVAVPVLFLIILGVAVFILWRKRVKRNEDSNELPADSVTGTDKLGPAIVYHGEAHHGPAHQLHTPNNETNAQELHPSHGPFYELASSRDSTQPSTTLNT